MQTKTSLYQRIFHVILSAQIEKLGKNILIKAENPQLAAIINVCNGYCIDGTVPLAAVVRLFIAFC